MPRCCWTTNKVHGKHTKAHAFRYVLVGVVNVEIVSYWTMNTPPLQLRTTWLRTADVSAHMMLIKQPMTHAHNPTFCMVTSIQHITAIIIDWFVQWNGGTWNYLSKPYKHTYKRIWLGCHEERKRLRQEGQEAWQLLMQLKWVKGSNKKWKVSTLPEHGHK